MHELDEQWTKGAGQADALRRAGAIDGRDRRPARCGTEPIAGNVIPLAGSRAASAGYTSEEWKLVHESRKILHADELLVTVTCVRVPVYVGHAMSANVQFAPPDVARHEAVELLADAPGRAARRRRRRASHARSRPRASTPCSSAVCARTRREPDTLNLWVTGDNLRKGAALNAVQMAELLGLGDR